MPQRSWTVKTLHAEARAAYEKYSAPETRAAARLQRGLTRANGNAAAGVHRSSR
ncbi:hypothetical protein [Streptomyces syringium]|uniref:hypothetical protein n=1 Tax=Streptomyces syringium TaxID=76729 RepID=UPI0037D9109A